MQYTKTVYFRDYPASGSKKSGLSIPYNENEQKAYSSVRPLSSYRIRKILGFELFADLQNAASASGVPVSTYARTILAKSTNLSSAAVEGIQATFRGGTGSPLHEWFPYLEGYSPDFVSSILEHYAPNARTVLDPFCGSGTTVLTAASKGIQGLYTEVNPVCRFIIDAKALALNLSLEDRYNVSNHLEALTDKLEDILARQEPDAELAEAYVNAFPGRLSFRPDTFKLILQARSLADRLPSPANIFFIVAVMRCLVPSSLLVRRGDLRFRTPAELAKGMPTFVSQLQESLRIISSDICDVESVSGSIQMIGDDAKKITPESTAQVDAVITSPPYLNGTNYFRNTKLELWFIRRLNYKSNLRGFRDLAITSGINDVTAGKSASNISAVKLPDTATEVIAKLNDVAYDARIPMMVESYFAEMSHVLAGLRSVCHERTVIAIDLGDSCYGSVWVPTHDVICEMMDGLGFRRIDLITLRERQSRSGFKLSQTLQVFHVR